MIKWHFKPRKSGRQDYYSLLSSHSSFKSLFGRVLTGLGIDERFARNDVNGRTDLLTDALNSTIALTDSTGTITQQYSYDPYGIVTQSDVTTGFTNPYLYTGREADSAGLYYYRARYYSPTMGRFISEDPLGFGGGQNNFYAYVGGNSLGFTDSMGLAPGDSFPSAQAAALDALNYIGSKPDRCSREYGGWVYKEWSMFGPPTYTYDEPAPLAKTGGSLPDMPEWHDTDAMFHNHPLIQGMDYDHFSFDDKDTAAADEIPSYLLIPDGSILRYVPGPGGSRDDGSVTKVGQAYGCGCTQ